MVKRKTKQKPSFIAVYHLDEEKTRKDGYMGYVITVMPFLNLLEPIEDTIMKGKIKVLCKLQGVLEMDIDQEQVIHLFEHLEKLYKQG